MGKNNPNNAFLKGILEVSRRSRGQAWCVREDISAALGGLCRSQYYNRQRGDVEHSPAERREIERIFEDYNITNPWGLTL